MKDTEHSLEAESSQAASTPLAEHEDELSPSKVLRETVASGGGQRVGDSGPVANPIVTFPDSEGLSEPRIPDEV